MNVYEYLGMDKPDKRDIDDVGMCPNCFTRNTDDEPIIHPLDNDMIVGYACSCNECSTQYVEDPQQYMEYA